MIYLSFLYIHMLFIRQYHITWFRERINGHMLMGLIFYHDVGEISDLSQSEAPNFVSTEFRVRVMQPTTPSPWRRGRSWSQFNVQEYGSMKCH